MAKAQTSKSKPAAAKAAQIHHFLGTPSDLGAENVENISASLRALLADVFALYLKTKNFHWHMSGRHFRDYHLLLDEQSDQIFAMTDPIAERARKIGGTTLHSISEISKLQRISDNNAEYVDAQDMLAELCQDNKLLTTEMRAVHELTSDAGDCATTSLLENWIDETERRTWFLFEASRNTSGAND
ncbi:DNA starvation/stationary phase protection protein [Acetobacter sacchari]|uniref:DNA starvation/stationary phase protection protein n=1 Tax=Acetobacter sacchari TaxID=2661687 RepID=A0ABS3LUT7_9PROT|nr:DNA starvation/stationary phase protection protein [Acetobacter sacchari]MBO1359641.1 DNA starvation/stationary phase protection protein [Acetobacter sacchari]